jgi:hypothetical protein
MTAQQQMKRAWVFGWLAAFTSVVVLIAAQVNPSTSLTLTLILTSFASAFNFRWYARLKKGLRLMKNVRSNTTLAA